MRLTTAYSRSKNICVLAVVVAELKFRDIQWKVLFADVVEGADNAAFEDAPKALNRVRVDRANDVIAARMVDSNVLRKFFVQVLVANPLIRNQQANLVRDSFLHETFERDSADVLNDAGNHIAFAANCADDNGFAGANTASSVTTAALILMPVFGFAANESFVHLDYAAKLIHFLIGQRHANTVGHVPSGFQRTKTHIAPELARTHPLFAGQHEVDDLEPIAKRLVRVLENRARNVRETVARLRRTLVALPMPRIALQLSGLRSATAGAMNALRPSLTDQIGATGFLIGKRCVELCRGQLVDLFPSSHGPVPHYGRILPCLN
jgi:hypothetical protein